jgi:hypothetical protein
MASAGRTDIVDAMIDELIIFLKMTWDCGACTLMATAVESETEGQDLKKGKSV